MTYISLSFLSNPVPYRIVHMKKLNESYLNQKIARLNMLVCPAGVPGRVGVQGELMHRESWCTGRVGA